MEPASLLEHLFDKKKVQVIRQFLTQPEREWTLVELARASRVPNATTYRILAKLAKLELIKEHKVKHLKTYTLASTPATKYLDRILEKGSSALDSFVELIKELEGVEKVILHGKKSKERSNILVIGKDVDTSAIRSAEAKIYEQYEFAISTLVIDPEQYEQMVSMGLYSGTKKELYTAPTSFGS